MVSNMRRATCAFLAALLACGPAAAADPAVASIVESTLATGSGQIRQFAFDGNPDTYFASAKHAGKADHFTLTFDKLVTVKSIEATTGKPDGGDALDSGTLEASADGTTFEPLPPPSTSPKLAVQVS